MDDNENSRWKDCEQVIRLKKDLKDLNTTDLDFSEGTWLFINDITRYFETNIKSYESIRKKKDFCIRNIGKEALHDYE